MNHKQNIDLASLVLAEELHLMDHVVSPRGGVEILSPNHHQNILTALGKPFTTFYWTESHSLLSAPDTDDHQEEEVQSHDPLSQSILRAAETQ